MSWLEHRSDLRNAENHSLTKDELLQDLWDGNSPITEDLFLYFSFNETRTVFYVSESVCISGSSKVEF